MSAQETSMAVETARLLSIAKSSRVLRAAPESDGPCGSVVFDELYLFSGKII